MPYESEAQRRWAHTATAVKKGFPTAEFDAASKGMRFPARAAMARRVTKKGKK